MGRNGRTPDCSWGAVGSAGIMTAGKERNETDLPPMNGRLLKPMPKSSAAAKEWHVAERENGNKV